MWRKALLTGAALLATALPADAARVAGVAAYDGWGYQSCELDGCYTGLYSSSCTAVMSTPAGVLDCRVSVSAVVGLGSPPLRGTLLYEDDRGYVFLPLVFAGSAYAGAGRTSDGAVVTASGAVTVDGTGGLRFAGTFTRA